MRLRLTLQQLVHILTTLLQEVNKVTINFGVHQVLLNKTGRRGTGGSGWEWAGGKLCKGYRGADKSLARPGRKQANVSVRMA